MEITFLGTSSMVPTKDRNQAGIFLSYRTEGLLFDCGEGTQRQLKIAGISPNKITKILVTHWHGDHVLGLPGLIQTMSASDYDRKLTIFGPKGTKKFFEHMKKAFSFEEKFPLEIVEVSKRKFFQNKEFALEALELEHGIPCLGFSFIEADRRRINVAYVKKLGIPEGPELGRLQNGKDIKWKGELVSVKNATKIADGKKITVIMDTRLCQNCIELANGADILISESTYADDLENKAEEYMHLTARDAGTIANKAGVKKLVLTHFSQRYKNVQQIEEDARTVFNNVLTAKDFMKISI